MSDIRQWLEKLGLGQYADAFEENAIVADVLADLSDADLEKLGVLMGHRKALLKAIASLSETDAASEAEATASATAVEAVGSTAPEADRRQLTVMFCDLVGSTALSEKLDPEDLRGVMDAYRKAASDVVVRYDGHVAQYLGDGVMVYFGWPQAHEDDAGRAVHAGLDIVAAVAVLEAETALAVRIGIATGLVVVGESGADEGADAKLAVGETPNIAARIQGLAKPGTVAIAQSTRRLLGGAFTLDDLGTHDAKGVSGGLRVHRVVGAADTVSRFEASHDAALTPLVGRESEILLLLDRWEQAKDGEGQVVLLSGEPGIGKSRITQELRERLAGEPLTRLRYQCSPFHTNSAFYPVIQQVERAAGITREDTPEQKLDKLEEALAQGIENVAAIAPLIGAMLSLSIDRYPPLDLSPQRQKEKTIEALAGLVVGLAGHDPVLMIFEDAHWIDPTTLEVLGSFIDRIQDHPVLLVITYRPEFEPPWSGYGHVTVHTLNRFSRRLGAAMVANVTGGKSLPDEVLEQIVAKTDGVPLFVEELTKTVLEAGFLKDAGDHYELDGPLPPLAIPTTLRDSLMARLDRLAPVKEVAQIGACIGREFSYGLLTAVSPLGENELQEALRELVISELVFQHGAAPDATYTFKHALVQDAAYESLLKSRRQQLHERIAHTLEAQFAELSESEPEVIAHHLSAAGLIEHAIPLWRKAGQRAAQRFANVEAMVHFQRAIDFLMGLPETPERDDRELDLRINLGPVMMAAKGYASRDVDDCYTRARALAQKLGDQERLFMVLYGLWQSRNMGGLISVAKDIADELVRMTEHDADSGRKLQAHHANWTSALLIGDPQGTYDHACAGIARYDPEQHRDHKYLYGAHDPAVCGWGVKAVASWLLGNIDESERLTADTLALAEKLGHPGSSAVAHQFTAVASYHSGNLAQTMAICDAGVEICHESGLLTWGYILKVVQARARAMLGGRNSTTEIQENIDVYRAAGHGVWLPWFMFLSAQTHFEAGEMVNAATDLERAFANSSKSGEAWYDAELHRLKGDLLLARSAGGTAAGEAEYATAMDIAQAQKAKSFELRAATSLARLLANQDRRDEARRVLEPVYGWFTEGFDTKDLKDAKALLDELK